MILVSLLLLIGCSKERKWIKNDLTENLWNEKVTAEIIDRCSHLETEMYGIAADPVDSLKREYQDLGYKLNLIGAMGMGDLFNAAGITTSRINDELESMIQLLYDGIENKCSSVKEAMDGYRILRDSIMIQQDLDYNQLAIALWENENCVDSVARCMMADVLFSVETPEIKKIQKKKGVWVVSYRNWETQYVIFSETFAGELVPQYSPFITDDGKLISVDNTSLY